MPVLASSAYVTVETITTLIRALANDMIYSQAGEILTDNANFMFPLLNDALEWFESGVNNHGVSTFTKETVLLGVLPKATVDPGVQVFIDDTGYFDGVVSNPPPPQVPPDLNFPLFLWERQHGSIEDWVQMGERPDGLPSLSPSSRLRIWEWRQDSIYMPGASQSNDVRMRYVGSHAPLVTPNDTFYFRNANGCLAYYMLSSYLASKNPVAAQMAESRAVERLNSICTTSARMKQREPISRSSYGNPPRGGNFYPPRNP